MTKIISQGCLQTTVLVAFMCFVMGFFVQVFFQLLPSSKSPNLRPHNHFIIDGKVVDITAEDIKTLVKHEEPILLNTKLEASLSMDTDTSQGLIKTGMNDVPNIVTAWRSAKLDWHQLLPSHSSIWERFGTPQSEGKLRLLVSKETLITDYLTRFQESGLSALYGHDYGPLKAYSGCNVFVSSCMIHDEKLCGADKLCKWSSAKELCVDVWENKVGAAEETQQQCAQPKIIGEHGFEKVKSIAECKDWIHEPAVVLSIDSESQSMFYHWWASWSGIVQYWKKELNSRRDVHFFIDKINDPMFFQFFGLLSDNCWRRTGAKHNPKSVCYCDTHKYASAQSREAAGPAAQQMLSYLNLAEVAPPVHKVRIGLISRRRKRFILNEYDLVQRIEQMGYECVLLPLEVMTLYEQMRALRSLDVLVGIHGSALDNSVFLHPESVIVQLLPFRVEHRVTFRATAEAAQVKYLEWQLQDQSLAVFHWDLLMQANQAVLAQMTQEEYLSRGQRGADNRETLMFWINQVSFAVCCHDHRFYYIEKLFVRAFCCFLAGLNRHHCSIPCCLFDLAGHRCAARRMGGADPKCRSFESGGQKRAALTAIVIHLYSLT